MAEAIEGRLVAVELDEGSIGRSTPDVEHERAIAVYDLLEDNRFALEGHPATRYRLTLAMAQNRLALEVREDGGDMAVTHLLSLSPLRRIVRDYFLICDSYYEAIRTATPSRIEAIDMGRRSVHDEGSRLLMERLKGKIRVDFDTARRLFTLVCALHWKA